MSAEPSSPVRRALAPFAYANHVRSCYILLCRSLSTSSSMQHSLTLKCCFQHAYIKCQAVPYQSVAGSLFFECHWFGNQLCVKPSMLAGASSLAGLQILEGLLGCMGKWNRKGNRHLITCFYLVPSTCRKKGGQPLPVGST